MITPIYSTILHYIQNRTCHSCNPLINTCPRSIIFRFTIELLIAIYMENYPKDLALYSTNNLHAKWQQNWYLSAILKHAVPLHQKMNLINIYFTLDTVICKFDIHHKFIKKPLSTSELPYHLNCHTIDYITAPYSNLTFLIHHQSWLIIMHKRSSKI